MNVTQRLACGAFLAWTTLAAAQSPTPSSDTGAQAAQTQEAATEIPAASATIAPIEPPSLIPPNNLPGPSAGSLPQIPGAPELQQLNSLFKQSSLGKAADEHRLRVQLAELETHIRNDQDLHQLKDFALQAPTDLERRHRLRAYYQRYYGKLKARATSPELLDYLKVLEAGYELSLLQPRVRHETDEAEAARLVQAKTGATVSPQPTPVQAKVNDIFRP